jgi:hypothetical protein
MTPELEFLVTATEGLWKVLIIPKENIFDRLREFNPAWSGVSG